MQKECERCKIIELMTELLKVNRETIKKLRAENEKTKQLTLHFNPN